MSLLPPPGDPAPFRTTPAERSALLRDGLVRPVIGDVLVARGAPSTTWLRARCVALLLPDPLDAWVVGYTSAAWVHAGYHAASPEPPSELEVLVAAGRRRPNGALLRIRQTEFGRGDVTELYGVPITTPVRTAADVARDLPPLDALATLHHLGSVAGVRPGQVLRQLSRMPYTRGCAAARPVVRAWAECA